MTEKILDVERAYWITYLSGGPQFTYMKIENDNSGLPVMDLHPTEDEMRGELDLERTHRYYIDYLFIRTDKQIITVSQRYVDGTSKREPCREAINSQHSTYAYIDEDIGECFTLWENKRNKRWHISYDIILPIDCFVREILIIQESRTKEITIKSNQLTTRFYI